MAQYRTKEEVHNRAREAVGRTIKELNGGFTLRESKSSVGDAFELWFGVEKNSDRRPDLVEAGVELKATPIHKIKSGEYRSKERLVLSIINYEELLEETFETSRFLNKNKAIQLGFYENIKDIPKDEWLIKETVLFELLNNPKDLEIIRKDWETIHCFIEQGKAHELSEKHTTYLSACTKGKNASSMRTQPNSDIPAKQRALSFKTGYMSSILNDYVLGDKKVDSIIKDPFVLQEKSLEEYIEEAFKPFIGWSIDKLVNHFGIEQKAKNTNYRIAMGILNLNGKNEKTNAFPKVEEFEKACIQLKTVKFNENGVNRESMSFPSFSFSELVNENWIDEEGMPSANWHVFLLETKFLFFVVKNDGEKDVFKGIKFFTMPEEDVEGPVYKVWQDTVDKLKNGVELKGTRYKSGKVRINNNFIKKSDKMICHVRPHETESDYSENGKYADKLPTPAKWINKPEGDKYSDSWMTKQCFWINNDYIKKQVQDLL
ncbi:DNA mismatch repair protein MutH [Mammaliicoccus vitulinus]|uniref:Sau3AI family type II restriction endonuclease n=1 Tax=Mammaliicoccus vitulinus TaxID=71237 RepID=UPI001AAD7344|nr:Sau3AI family type II restriction endonuclease [Mammaliicoccus vitulinus]MBO3077766.1 DNA mismatch repair protein MutH [Mammaliicoccus vitulinus]